MDKEEPSVSRLDERTKYQAKNITDLWNVVTEQSKCIRRLERRTWLNIGQNAGIAILLGFVLAKMYGGL